MRVVQRMGRAGIRRCRPRRGHQNRSFRDRTTWSISLPRNQLILPGEGLFSYRPLPKRGQICDIPAPPPNRGTTRKSESNVEYIVVNIGEKPNVIHTFCAYNSYAHNRHVGTPKQEILCSTGGGGLGLECKYCSNYQVLIFTLYAG